MKIRSTPPPPPGCMPSPFGNLPEAHVFFNDLSVFFGPANRRCWAKNLAKINLYVYIYIYIRIHVCIYIYVSINRYVYKI